MWPRSALASKVPPLLAPALQQVRLVAQALQRVQLVLLVLLQVLAQRLVLLASPSGPSLQSAPR
jgi:hypothetical protein